MSTTFSLDVPYYSTSMTIELKPVVYDARGEEISLHGLYKHLLHAVRDSRGGAGGSTTLMKEGAHDQSS